MIIGLYALLNYTTYGYDKMHARSTRSFTHLCTHQPWVVKSIWWVHFHSVSRLQEMWMLRATCAMKSNQWRISALFLLPHCRHMIDVGYREKYFWFFAWVTRVFSKHQTFYKSRYMIIQGDPRNLHAGMPDKLRSISTSNAKQSIRSLSVRPTHTKNVWVPRYIPATP